MTMVMLMFVDNYDDGYVDVCWQLWWWWWLCWWWYDDDSYL